MENCAPRPAAETPMLPSDIAPRIPRCVSLIGQELAEQKLFSHKRHWKTPNLDFWGASVQKTEENKIAFTDVETKRNFHREDW